MKIELVTTLKRQATQVLGLLEGIKRGEKAVAEDRTFTQEEAERKMFKWLK